MDNLLLKECELSMSQDSFCIHAPDFEVAVRLKRYVRWLAAQAVGLGKRDTKVFYPGCLRPYQIPARFAMSTDLEGSRNLPDREQMTSNQAMPELLGADYMRILEFLMEQREQGNIVIVTSNTSNICLHTSDLLKPSRAVWTAARFSGYNYLQSWRASREDNPRNPQRLNPQFDRLRSLLESDGVVPNYAYTLYRPDDTLCSYETTYFLCNDYCGDQVRIGVSRPQDWAIVEPAPV